MSEIKVGDRVRCLTDNYMSIKKGQIDTVAFIGEHNGKTKLITSSMEKLHPDKSGWGNPDNFKKVEDYVAQVGDMVRCIKSRGEWLTEGQITTITFAGDHKGIRKVMTPELDVDFPDKQGWAEDFNFEKVEGQLITRENLGKIRKEVCYEWRRRIDEALGSADPLSSNVFVLNEDIIKGHKEANSEQKELIERLFKMPKYPFSSDQLKNREVMLTDSGEIVLALKDTSSNTIFINLTSLKVEPSNKKIFGEKMNAPVQVILNK